MSLLRKLHPLLVRSQTRENRYQFSLMLLKKDQCVLKNESKALSTQHLTLQQMIKNHCFKGISSRSELFLEQRKLSVLRRQLLLLVSQQEIINGRLQVLQKKIDQALVSKHRCMRSSNKYKFLIQIEQKKQLIRQERLNESEIEELILWKK